MKKFLVVFSVLFATVAMLEASTSVVASQNTRLSQCAWYKQQANAAGRKGNAAAKDRYWQQYRDCMRGRID